MVCGELRNKLNFYFCSNKIQFPIFEMERVPWDLKCGQVISILFEKVFTMMACPSCHHSDTLVHNPTFQPFEDIYCTNCKYHIEIKSIRKFGKQAKCSNIAEGNSVKLGSLGTYKKLEENQHTGLLLVWYTPVTICGDVDCNKWDCIHHIDIYEMMFLHLEDLTENDYHFNIVMQKKKPKHELVFHLSMLNKAKFFDQNIFQSTYSYHTNRQYIYNAAHNILELQRVLTKIANSIEKKKRKRQDILEYKQMRKMPKAN